MDSVNRIGFAVGLSAVALFAGCTSVRFVRVGDARPSSPPDCRLRFEHLTPEQANAQGEREVGSGCAAGYCNDDNTHCPAEDFTADIKEDVQPKACALGGDLVIITGVCTDLVSMDGSSEGLQLMVLAKDRARP